MKDYWITKLWRLSRKFYEKKLTIFSKIIKIFIRIFFSATLPYSAEIGFGTRFPHGAQGVVVNDNAKIGKNCVVGAGTVIGGKSTSIGAPNIGDNVVIGANSTIIGNVNIGNNSVVGAGAVVVKNIPPNTIYAGNPAKYIKRNEVKQNEKKW